MKRIGNSEEPNEKIITNILLNLNKKFPDQSFSIGIDSWVHYEGEVEILYRLWDGKLKDHLAYDCSWPELLKAYRNKMKETTK